MSTQQPRPFNILLIGDVCTDVYQFGTVDRLSPEAPVPVFVPTYTEQRQGMAGNVASNLEALGCRVNLLSGEPSTKTRLIDSRSKQHIARIDQDVRSEAIRFHTSVPPVYDAVVISDYAKGSVDYETVESVLKSVTCPVFIDTKLTDLRRMGRAWVKINDLEHSRIRSTCPGLIVTRGSAGAEIPGQNYTAPAPSVEVVDVTGAGDTFLAALTYGYLMTTDIQRAVRFAIRAASITVQHLGVHAPTLEEINDKA